MKKYIYLLSVLFSTSIFAQRSVETPIDLVPFSSNHTIRSSFINHPLVIHCCCYLRSGDSDNGNYQKTGFGTGLEGHNFIENPAIIYPNPVKDVINIKSTDPITVIEILNMQGQVDKTLNPRNEQMDVSDLPAGTYFARIYFEGKKDVQVEKILIVK